MSVERRDYPRIKVAWRAKAAVPQRGILRGIVKDVTLGGVYLEIDAAMAPGQQFLMEFYPFMGTKVCPIKIRGEVTHDTVLSGNRGHGLGVRIIEVGEEDRKTLRKILDSLPRH